MGVAVKCRSREGCEECSAGESKGTIKSSRFIGSEVASWFISWERSGPAGDTWSDKCICAMPLGVGLRVSEALFGHQYTSHVLQDSQECFLPSLLLPFLALEIHGHHSPCQILHALLVGQLRLCPGIEFPNLSGQRIFPLHLIRVVATGCAACPFRKDGISEDTIIGVGGTRGTEWSVKGEVVGHHMRIGVEVGEGHRLGWPGSPVPSMMYPLHNLRWRGFQ